MAGIPDQTDQRESGMISEDENKIALDDLIKLADNLKQAPVPMIILTKRDIDYLKKNFPVEYQSIVDISPILDK